MAHAHRILSREAGLISVEVGLAVNGYLGGGWWGTRRVGVLQRSFYESNMVLGHTIDLRRLRLPVLQIDHAYSRRAAVEDKKFALCERERRRTFQFVWRHRGYGPESVSLKIKNKNGVHMRARRVQPASVGIDGEVLKAKWLCPLGNRPPG